MPRTLQKLVLRLGCSDTIHIHQYPLRLSRMVRTGVIYPRSTSGVLHTLQRYLLRALISLQKTPGHPTISASNPHVWVQLSCNLGISSLIGPFVVQYADCVIFRRTFLPIPATSVNRLCLDSWKKLWIHSRPVEYGVYTMRDCTGGLVVIQYVATQYPFSCP